jgi:nicotinamidase-related amidase
MTAKDSLLLVIDIQDKLLTKIPTAAELVSNTAFLLDAARLLGVPALGTEQYPKGLGPMTAEIRVRLSDYIPSKTAFSCCGAAFVFEELHQLNRPNVILVGMETHVCVLQTAIDLLSQGFRPWLVRDALAARYHVDHETALRRLESAGAILTTCETVVFEWLGDASHPKFKDVSRLIQDRMKGQS